MTRLAVFALAPLRALASRRGKSPLTATVLESLLWLCRLLRSAVPRLLSCVGPLSPVLIFTDGAVEGSSYDVVTIGALLVDAAFDLVEYFGCHVEE